MLSRARTLLLGLSFLGSASLAVAQVGAFTFQPADPIATAPVTFTDASTGAPTLWLWNFGDPAAGPDNTSAVQNPTHTFALPGSYVVTLLVSGGSVTSQTLTVTGGGPGSCVATPRVLCLYGNRFQVTANWTTADGNSGNGMGTRLTDESGYFWFFDPANIEFVTKVLNGCPLSNSYWVFAAGLTDVQVDWQVVDTVTGAQYTQQNPMGTPFAPVQATNAFPSSCP